MKRFTETTKWSDPWFRKLPARLKLLWNFFLDNCDSAGVIEIDWELASFQIGEDVSDDDLPVFSGRLEQLENGKIFISKFIEFQYGTLQESCRPHASVLKLIKSHGISERVSKGYPKGIHTHKDKDKDKEQDKDQDKDKDRESKSEYSEAFEQFWIQVPHKVAKGEAWKEWKAAIRAAPAETIISNVWKFKASEDARQATSRGDFQHLHPSRWLKRRRWEDEISEATPSTPSLAPVRPREAWQVSADIKACESAIKRIRDDPKSYKDSGNSGPLLSREASAKMRPYKEKIETLESELAKMPI